GATTMNQHRHTGGSHPLGLWMFLCILVDGLVGGFDGAGNVVDDIFLVSRVVDITNRIDAQLRRDFTGGMPAHAVTDDEEGPFCGQLVLIRGHIMCYVVLVVLSPTANIRQSSSRETKFLSQRHPL